MVHALESMWNSLDEILQLLLWKKCIVAGSVLENNFWFRNSVSLPWAGECITAGSGFGFLDKGATTGAPPFFQLKLLKGVGEETGAAPHFFCVNQVSVAMNWSMIALYHLKIKEIKADTHVAHSRTIAAWDHLNIKNKIEK